MYSPFSPRPSIVDPRGASFSSARLRAATLYEWRIDEWKDLEGATTFCSFPADSGRTNCLRSVEREFEDAAAAILLIEKELRLQTLNMVNSMTVARAKNY